MKKISVLIISALLSINSYAQDTDSETHNRSGIKGGYSLASVTDSDGNETDSRSGFHIGFYAESELSDAASLQVELLYSQQGFTINDPNYTLEQKVDYINVPLSLKLYAADALYFEAGPQVGLAISKKETFTSTLVTSAEESDPRSFDWGFNLGAGINLHSGLTIGARYYLGMGEIYENNNDFKNRVLQFSIGFAL